MESGDWCYRVIESEHRWVGVLAIVLLCGALAAGAGFVLAELGALYALAGSAALGLGLWMLRDVEVAYWCVIGTICLLPFASLPFDIGFTPTLLDVSLGALFVVWVLQIATGTQRSFIGTPLGLPVLIFMLIAVGAFVFGLSHALLTSYLLRHFAEIILSIGLFFLVANTVRGAGRLVRVTRALLLSAFAAGLVGVALYVVASFVSEDFVVRVLSAMARVGYPSGPGVLRYIRDDPELPLRATSTSVDPNVLGSLLNMVLAIGVPQLFAQRPPMPRAYLFVGLVVLAVCLGLTLSRGSILGLGVALAIVATLRYRKLWVVLVASFVVLLVLPQTQTLIGHFMEGFRLEDLATQMRLGEYKDAFILIGRYPWLGVGFAGSPDIDTYIGVSNVYLLIAEQVGLIGLAGFVFIMVIFFFDFWRSRRAAARDPQLEPLWWGLHAGILGALVGGMFDHYFFNLDFHHSVTLFWLVAGLAAAATSIIRSRAAAAYAGNVMPEAEHSRAGRERVRA